MAKKRIFIASATESRPIAEKIAQALADAGHEPRRWWKEFRAGDITLDRLIRIAQLVDGAVFLFTSVDKLWYREKQIESPRDNVVLEYGLFVAHLSRPYAMILTDGQAKLPSDINAITYERIIDDTETVSQRVVDHFRHAFASYPEPPSTGVPIVADPMVVEDQIRARAPRTWASRSLYVGIEGAQGWLATVEAPTYAPQIHEGQIKRVLAEAVSSVEVRSIVSLGPGDAETDEVVVLEAQRQEPWLEYIPVDLCDALLLRAVNRLCRQARVPVGVLADFEDGMNFVHRQLDEYATSPKLFGLFGGTFGNLDRKENSFLSRVGQRMEKGDYLLFDVPVAGSQWVREHDRRGSHASFGPEYRRFIAQGICRHTGETVPTVIDAFDTRIRFDEGLSDVDNTKCIDIVDSESGQLILSIRRYDWPSLLEWLKKRREFEVVFDRQLSIDGALGDGVLLLRRR